ncbi:hypothetical protein [Clostridium sp. CF012]|uniref:hypothetical protein n=1 Tax=Clostridium sp. CF012 TaxID=2843319 RepID=UPI001C0BDCD6|nr:hypothetical protein [Clostridium sp. CF012]MBU3146895.1 hypothetical protein [Clostridium sp. CF012]
MYDYILMRWTMAYVTDLWVMDRVPKFLTDAQCAVILNTTQSPGTLLSKMATV